MLATHISLWGLGMQRTASLIFGISLFLSACGGQPEHVSGPSCDRFLAMTADEKAEVIGEQRAYSEAMIEYLRNEDSNYSTRISPDFSENLLLVANDCKRYGNRSVDLYTLDVLFENPIEESTRQSSPLHVDSSCIEYSKSSTKQRTALVDDLIQGTGMRLGRDFSPYATEIKACVSEALSACAGGLKVRDAMAACMATLAN